MTIINGSCHCGNLSYRFETTFDADTLPIRACQCSFCRAHGAHTATDPDGTARLFARDPSRLLLYRFAHGVTEFVMCSQCGIYVGAVISDGDQKFITLNMNLAGLDVSRAEAVEYDGESAKSRLSRRCKKFTPLIEHPLA